MATKVSVVDDKGAGESPADPSPAKKSPGQSPGSGETEHQAGDEVEGLAVPYRRFAEHRAQFRQQTEELATERAARLKVEEENDRLTAMVGDQPEDEQIDPLVKAQITAKAAERKAERAEARVDASERQREKREEFKDQEREFNEQLAKHPELADSPLAKSFTERAYWFSVFAMGEEIDASKFVSDVAGLLGPKAAPTPNDKLRGLPDDDKAVQATITETEKEKEDARLNKLPFHLRMRAKMARASKAAAARIAAGDKKTSGM